MSTKNIIIILVILAALSAIPFFFGDKIGQDKTGATDTNTTADTSGDVASASDSVSIENFAFNSDNITVKKGTTVTFTNNDAAPHTVTSDVGGGQTGLDSPMMQTGDTYTFTFDEVGTYRYHCEVHPSMRATITVVE